MTSPCCRSASPVTVGRSFAPSRERSQTPTVGDVRLNVLRGAVALFFTLFFLVLFDPLQRLVVVPLAWLLPARKVAILARWQHIMRWISVSPIIYIGGARFPKPVEIQGGDGVLIIMNHQSIFDIPLVVESLPVSTFPRFITRKRYFKGIPLVSHLLRVYEYPSVDPHGSPADMKKSLASIRDAARKTDAPICIFPEGTRTRDGEVGEFRPTGLKVILKQRAWKVYVLAGDGYWKTAKMKDFAFEMSHIRGKLEIAGVFDWPDPKQDSEVFIGTLRQALVDRLAEMRRTDAA